MKTKNILFFFVLCISCIEIQAQQALNLTASVQWVNLGNLSVSGSTITVEALIYWTGGGPDVVSKHTDPSNVNYLLRPTTFELTTSGSGFYQMTNPFTLQNNKWYHIAGTYDGSYIRYYVNGCLVIEHAWSGNLVTNSLATAIGNISTAPNAEQFLGMIDEVRIWNVARTQAQIQANMTNLPSPTTQTGLLAYYQFEGNLTNAQGTTSRNGTAVGAISYAANNVTLEALALTGATVCTPGAIGTVTISSNDASATYSSDGTNFQASNTFTGISAGSHIFYARSITGCTVDTTLIIPTQQITQNATICYNSTYTLPSGTVVNTTGTYTSNFLNSLGCDSIITTNLTVIPNTLSVSNDTAICAGYSTPLNATGAFTYTWTPTTGLSNPNIANPVATPTTTTQYIVQGLLQGQNLIVNGDFEAGNTGFSSGYTYSTPNPMAGPGHYYVGTSITNSWFPGCADHTPTGAGNMIIADGADGSSGIAVGSSIWCQTVSVEPGIDYAFSTWLTNLNSSGATSQLRFSINGTQIGSTQNTSIGVCQWNQFYVTWNSGIITSANICIAEASGAQPGNDFAIDDISFSPICTAYDTVTVTVKQLSYSTQNPVICANGTFTRPSGTIVNTSGTYIDTLTAANGCDSIITTNLTVNPAPHLSQNVVLCPNDIFTRPGGSTTSTSGTYIDTLQTVNSCDSIITTNLTIIPNTLSVSNDTAICAGHSAQLNATGAFTYSWTPTTGLSSTSIANPVATPPSTTQYVVHTLVQGQNVIVNGDFEAGNTGFTTSYNYSASNNTQAQYNVGTNPHSWNSGLVSCGDHTTGSGRMMLVDGAPTPNTNIWCQTIGISANTDYAFSCWISNNNPQNPPVLQFNVNSSLLATPFNVSSATCNWQQFYTTWNSGTSTSANICIVNQNTIPAGNDFSLDDISFAPICNVYDTVTVTVNQPAYSTQNPVICANQTFIRPSGAIVSTAGTYYDTLHTTMNCDSIITTNLTVNPIYQITQNPVICSDQTYTRPNGTTVSTTGIYIDTLPTINGCDSIITTNLTVNPVYTLTIFDTICSYQSYTRPAGSIVNTTGTYVDTVPTINGCDSIITTNLTVINLSITDTFTEPLCFGASNGSITITTSGGLLPMQYAWSNPSFSGTNISNVASGNYSVIATDAFGCSISDNINVTQPTQLVINPTYTEPLCYGEANGTILIPTQGGTSPYQYQLNGNNSAVDSFGNLTEGTYHLVVTDNNNCSTQTNVTVTQPDTVSISYYPPILQVLLSGIPFSLTTNYSDSIFYSWSPTKGLSCTECPNPTINPDSSIQYILTITVTPHGKDCVYKFPLLVGVNREHNFYVPNAFSPNGNSVNDYFQIFTDGKILKQLHIQIFDRWGEEVFESWDEDFKWDGTYKGNVVAPGIYVYTMKLVFMDDAVRDLSGSISVIR